MSLVVSTPIVTSLYAKFGNTLFKVNLEHRTDDGRYILNPANGKPYQTIFVSQAMLANRKYFKLYPIFSVVQS